MFLLPPSDMPRWSDFSSTCLLHSSDTGSHPTSSHLLAHFTKWVGLAKAAFATVKGYPAAGCVGVSSLPPNTNFPLSPDPGV